MVPTSNRRQFIWKVGYLGVGVPVATGWVVIMYALDYGVRLRRFNALEVLPYLIGGLGVWLVSGYLFGAGMWRAFDRKKN